MTDTATRGDAGPEGLAARRAAFAVLNDIFYKRRSLDEALDPRGAAGTAFMALESRDRAFVRLLVSVVLKRAREFDRHLETLLHEPLSALAPAQLLTIFRMGMAQMSVLRTPPHAVVDTSVELAAAEGISHHKSLVNAVLRRLAREGYEPLAPRDAGRAMLPDWLWSEWVADYGVETALSIAAAMMEDGPVDFSLRDPSPVNIALWAQKLEAAVLPNGSLRKASGGFIPSLEGFEAGEWWVQNAAAALPAQILGAAPGMTVVDLCAAPGGKTAQLAAAGARVTALDRSAPRMQRLQENMQRLQLDVETVVADGAAWQPPVPVDAVLLDAPCSATGTLRHQPDALWLKQPADQKKLAALQARLLDNAWRMLKPGGALVYCTCSLQKEEGETQVDAFLARTPDAQRRPIALAALAPALTSEGDLRILPQHWAESGGLDGFYIARLVKS
jgi:16S rRNA (cytosine967-C5)-methyltransferase